jgi:hypothetical protein
MRRLVLPELLKCIAEAFASALSGRTLGGSLGQGLCQSFRATPRSHDFRDAFPQLISGG